MKFELKIKLHRHSFHLLDFNKPFTNAVLLLTLMNMSGQIWDVEMSANPLSNTLAVHFHSGLLLLCCPLIA